MVSLVIMFAIKRPWHNIIKHIVSMETIQTELKPKALGLSCTCTGLALRGSLDRFACVGHYPGSHFPFGLQHASDEPCESMMGGTDNREVDVFTMPSSRVGGGKTHCL